METIFDKLLAGKIPADVVFQDDWVTAFRDVNPQAPTHVLVVPRTHYADAAELAHRESSTLAELVTVAAHVAENAGHADYRLVFNTGAGAGQSVFHTHLHLLAGRSLSWPPG